jgi:hypothetical protein
VQEKFFKPRICNGLPAYGHSGLNRYSDYVAKRKQIAQLAHECAWDASLLSIGILLAIAKAPKQPTATELIDSINSDRFRAVYDDLALNEDEGALICYQFSLLTNLFRDYLPNVNCGVYMHGAVTSETIKRIDGLLEIIYSEIHGCYQELVGSILIRHCTPDRVRLESMVLSNIIIDSIS